MEIASFIIIVTLIRFVRKSLETATRLPEWDKILRGIQAAAIGLLVADGMFDVPLISWLWNLLLLGLVGLIYLMQHLGAVRKLVWAVGPYIAVAIFGDIVKLISRPFYNRNDAYFQSALLFTIVWMVGIWYTQQQQQKALEKERSRRIEEEEQKRIVVDQNAELERLVAQRTAEITRQKEELQSALDELQATQDQLIQREKMASLGELTAGIAHEIQNPLNFVNNFAEVSAELIEELQEERKRSGKEPDELEEEILTDLMQNLQKITHHGQRAESIVKGMLEHSRTATGEKQQTDLNALADEYLRLSYHGLRAKDKSFNAKLDTHFDPALGKIEAVPQDLGRVLLNLFNNAFYAIHQKQQQLGEGSGYQPQVSVSTRREADELILTIRDNGTGIPQELLNKIFQPFFTTKPAGQGTGLGLSLSYDIITKGHGGELEVETEKGQFTQFIIHLPLAA